MDLGPLFSIGDDPGTSQQRQMAGDGRHICTNQLGQLAHTSLTAMGQFLDDEQPCGVGQGFEDLGTGIEAGESLRIHKRVGPGILGCLQV